MPGMVLEFPSPLATPTARGHGHRASACVPAAADGLPCRADLQQLLLQLQRVGDGGHSAGVEDALRRLGCRTEHEAMLQLLRWLLAHPVAE